MRRIEFREFHVSLSSFLPPFLPLSGVSAGKPKPGAKSNPKIIPFARLLLDHRAFISHGDEARRRK